MMPHTNPEARAAYHKAYEAKRHGTRNVYMTDWRKRHPEYGKDRPPRSHESMFSHRLRHRYGIAADDYDRMLAEQGGGCAMCGRTGYPSGRRLSVDHDHRTGTVRALLCQGCNVKVGHYEAGEFQLVEAYLARFGG